MDRGKTISSTMWRKKLRAELPKSKQLKNHTEQHQYAKEIPLYNINKKHTIDSRKMIDSIIPEPYTAQAHGLIIYNEQQKKWNCTQCEKHQK